jgi:hypothetical protein
VRGSAGSDMACPTVCCCMRCVTLTEDRMRIPLPSGVRWAYTTLCSTGAQHGLPASHCHHSRWCGHQGYLTRISQSMGDRMASASEGRLLTALRHARECRIATPVH